MFLILLPTEADKVQSSLPPVFLLCLMRRTQNPYEMHTFPEARHYCNLGKVHRLSWFYFQLKVKCLSDDQSQLSLWNKSTKIQVLITSAKCHKTQHIPNVSPCKSWWWDTFMTNWKNNNTSEMQVRKKITTYLTPWFSIGLCSDLCEGCGTCGWMGL